eukprot:NODE_314_length_11212_cov_0.272924.p7 type:complete len:134 gc:universal NODE_314_length_11212_cov_0.272924:9959-9558(-)
MLCFVITNVNVCLLNLEQWAHYSLFLLLNLLSNTPCCPNGLLTCILPNGSLGAILTKNTWYKSLLRPLRKHLWSGLHGHISLHEALITYAHLLPQLLPLLSNLISHLDLLHGLLHCSQSLLLLHRLLINGLSH